MIPSYHLRRAIEKLQSEGLWVTVKGTACYAIGLAKISLRPAKHAQLANYRLAIREMRAKAAVLKAAPRDITIESTTYCNLQCVMCEHSQQGMVAKRHFPEHLVERLTPFLSTASRFQLHSLGEPLMSPAFWRLLTEITRVHRGQPEITFNSNGLLLNETNIARLLDSKVREVSISFDAATAATYAKVRGGDFDKLVDNVAILVRARAAARRHDLKIVLNMTLMRVNIEELPAFVRLSKRLGADEVAFWRLNDGDNYERPDWVVEKSDWRFSYRDECPKHFPNLFNAKVREALDVARELQMPVREDFSKAMFIEGEGQAADQEYRPFVVDDGDGQQLDCGGESPSCIPPLPAERRNETVPDNLVELKLSNHDDRSSSHHDPALQASEISQCEAPWRWLVVNNRGDCQPCCFSQGTVGNLEHQSVAEIWNGPTMQEIRTSIAEGKVHRLCQGAACRYVRGASAAG